MRVLLIDPRVDVVIIGAGAGGAAIAWRLTQHGLRVLLLEAGPRYDPVKDYKLHTVAWETSLFPEKPGSQGKYTFAPMQVLKPEWKDLLSWDKVSDRIYRGTHREPAGTGYQHVRGLGGSTLHYTGEAHRLNPHAMRMHSRFGVAADWPIDYATLEPYYTAAENLIGVAGPENTGDRWRSTPYPLPPHPLSKGSKKLRDAAHTLGMNWVANSRAALSRPYAGRPACNYCGNCNRGCPRADKGSVDVTFIPQAIATGLCKIQTDTAVTRIEAGSDHRIKYIEFVDQHRKKHRITTNVLVMVCGAIETPRLLLASHNRYAPHGLANESGLVGKNLMETLGWVSTGLVEDDLESFKGLPADAICWDHNRPDSIPGVVGGCRFSSAIHEANLVGPVNYALRIVPGWGAQHKQALRKKLGQAISVGAIGEFLPNPGTFVELDKKINDTNGMPLAKIHSRLEEHDILRLQFMAKTCRSILIAAGASELVEEYGTLDFFNSTHLFGTCRMGTDSLLSVVDPNGRSYEWENLYICDASIFPSSGGGESPSLTIQALAIRTADKIASR